MGSKPNPLLEKYERKAKAEAAAEYQVMLGMHTEINEIAHMVSIHRKLGVGPGRADACFEEYQNVRLEVAKAILKETSEDEQGEFCKTQRDLALCLKRIFGPEAWEKHKHRFPILSSYIDLV